MKFPTKTIGVLGGMGPAATHDFFGQLINYSTVKYSASQDYEFPKILLYNMPLIGFNEKGFSDKRKVLEQLKNGVKFLERSGVDFIVIPCNTVHFFFDEMQAEVRIPIISIVKETSNKIVSEEINKVALLSSESTRDLNIYDHQLEVNNIEVYKPNENEQRLINKAILNIMGGRRIHEDRDNLVKIIYRLKDLGAQEVVLGCTELPLLIRRYDVKMKILNTTQILAEKAVDLAYNC